MKYRVLIIVTFYCFSAQALYGETTDTPVPVTNDVEVCDNETISDLYVSGTAIKWYADPSDLECIDEDGQEYQTVSIGGKYWMAENLNVGDRISGGQNATNNSNIEKYCLDNSSVKCNTYGGLYQWDEAMAYSTEVGAQGICPDGWHIPSHEEWKQLEIALGMDPTEADNVGARGTQGDDLKVNGGSGFDALMAGKRTTDGYLLNEGSYTTFWTSTYIYNRTISENQSHVYVGQDDKDHGFSVRCVQDASEILHSGNYFDTGETEPGTYTYYVSQTIGGVESARVPITLTIYPAPTVQITGDSEACMGENVELDAGNFSTYLWSNAADTRTIDVSNTGSYSVTVTDENNCSASDQKQVFINALPVISIEYESDLCIGTSVELDAGSELYDFEWSTNETTQTIEVTSSGTYYVSARDKINGCENTGQVSVVFVECGGENHQPDLRDSTFSIEENSPSGTFIGELNGKDIDVGQELSYAILSGNEDLVFDLDSRTGMLKVLSELLLDHETNPQFELRVQVQDDGDGLLSDEATFTIIVQDVNEVPVMEDQEIIIFENIPKDVWVGPIIASDQDAGQTLSYEIEFGNNSNAFKLNSETGGLRVNNPDAIDYEQYQEFNLKISATDDGTPPLSAEAYVRIILNDVVETGVCESGVSDFRIFPNPTFDKISIELNSIRKEELSIDVYDSKGMLRKQVLSLSSDQVAMGSIEIDFEESGVYFVKVYSDSFMRIEKIICY